MPVDVIWHIIAICSHINDNGCKRRELVAERGAPPANSGSDRSATGASQGASRLPCRRRTASASAMGRMPISAE